MRVYDWYIVDIIVHGWYQSYFIQLTKNNKTISLYLFVNMDLKRKEFTPKKEDKHQSSKKRVSNSKFRSLICRVFLLILEEYLSSYYIHITFNGFRDFYLLFYSFGKSTVIYNYCFKHSEWRVTCNLDVCVFHIWAS